MRYYAVKAIPDSQNNSWGVFDTVLGKLLENGKEMSLRVSSEAEALDVIDDMVQRVGA